MKLEHRLSALLQIHLHSWLNTRLQWIGHRHLQDQTRTNYVFEFDATSIGGLTVSFQPHVYELTFSIFPRHWNWVDYWEWPLRKTWRKSKQHIYSFYIIPADFLPVRYQTNDRHVMGLAYLNRSYPTMEKLLTFPFHFRSLTCHT